MLIYLFSFTKKEGERERKEAGIMYMPTAKAQFKATDVVSSDDALREQIKVNLKRSGLYLDDTDIINAMESGEEKQFMDLKKAKEDDGYAETKLSSLVTLEQFGLIERYINHLFGEVLDELKDGKVSPDPLESEDRKSSACDWCKYHAICRFDSEARQRKRSDTPLVDMEEELK
jgi:ATP-dependent helicase/nuclease subunit B